MVLAVLGIGAGPAVADDDASWEIRTASNSLGSDRPNYRYSLDPGGRLQDGLVIVNHGKAPLHLAVYAADGFTAKGGRLDLVAKGARSTKIGAWVRPDRPDVTVQPGKSAEVPFTIALPGEIAPGDYMGGIVTSPAQTAGSDAGQRRGIRIRLRVGGHLKPGLAVENLRVNYSGSFASFGKGDATVGYTIRNTGNAIVRARQAVSVSGPFGSLRVSAPNIADSPELLPGDTWKVSVPVSGVAPTVRLTGKVSIIPLLTDASGSVAPLAAAETTAAGWGIPWAPLLVLIVVCVIIGVLASRYRRRRAGLGKDEDEDAEEAPGETAVEDRSIRQEPLRH